MPLFSQKLLFSHKLLPLSMLPAEPLSLGTTQKSVAIPRPRRTNFAASIKQAVSMHRRSMEDALVGNPNRFVDFSKRQLCPD